MRGKRGCQLKSGNACWAWLLAGVCLAAVSCSKKDRHALGDEVAGSAGEASEPVAPFAGTVDEYWESALKAVRARQEECIGIPADYGPSDDGRILPAADLIETQVEWWHGFYQPGLDAGRARLDAEVAANCLRHLSEQSCDDVRREFALVQSCVDGALVGLVPRDGACAHSQECADTGDFCTEHLQGALGQCEQRALVGESCETQLCSNDAVCEGPAQGPLGFICIARKNGAAGTPCVDTGECVDGSFCNGQCHPYADDLSCTQNADCPYYLPCVINPGEASGYCGRGRSPGEACRRDPVGTDCAYALDCLPRADGALLCTSIWVGLGEPCRNGAIACVNSACAFKNNQEGTCVPFGQLGEPCYDNSCAPGLECGGTVGCQPTPP